MKRLPKVLLFPLILLGLISFPVYAQEGYIDASKLLRDSLILIAEIRVEKSQDEKPLWKTTVQKITIPGRSVSIILENNENKLEVSFIIYPAKYNSLLVAQSDIVYQGDFDTALTTYPLNYGEPLYYYPLGRSTDADSSDLPKISMKITVMPYIETMDKDTKNTLKEALEESSRFKFSEIEF